MKRYIVGVDFGHGETAAWVVPVSDVEGTDLGVEGDSLKLRVTTTSDNDKLIDSVVYRLKNGEFTLESSPCSNIYTELKSTVYELNQNPEKREAYKAYIRLVIERLLSANSLLGKEEDGDWNFHLCIACPTQWPEKEKNDYVQFFNEALSEKGLSVLWVINESDAAFFTHRPKDNPNKGVLVIDFGSSTIDYTFIYNGKKESEDSWSDALHGASCIEKAARTAYKDSFPKEYQNAYANTVRILAETGNAHINVESRLLYVMRKAKEDSYKNCDPLYTVDFNFGKYIGVKGPASPFKHVADFEFYTEIDSIIGGDGGYQDSILASFQGLEGNIRKKVCKLEGCKGVERIILSGGACNMGWVRSMVKAVFPEAEIVEDRHPSYVVAKGIALYAQAQLTALSDLRMAVSRINFEDIYKKADTNATIKAIEKLLPTVVDCLSRKSVTGHEIRKAFCDFLKGLNKENNQYCQYVQQNLDEGLSSAVRQEVKKVLSNVFNITVDTSDIFLHVDAVIIPFSVSCFEQDGDFYNIFTRLIEDASGRFSFTWDIPRDVYECKKIASGTAKSFLEVIKYKDDPFTYSVDELSQISVIMRQQVLDSSVSLFYKKQLFDTKFVLY